MTGDAEALVRAVTQLSSVPLVPELRLHLLMPTSPLWRATPDEARLQGLELPYWAFAWPGGQALARWVLDHRESVHGQRVLDVGSGGAIEGLAAMTSGATQVVCADVDPVASVAAQLNATANGVRLETVTVDVLAREAASFDCDVVLVGDLTFDEALTVRLIPWLRAHRALGREVLVGDAGRVPLPIDLEVIDEHAAPFDGNPEGSVDWRVLVRRLR
ncbi:MAG: 50S ribosomal protein L11 methyltransferase [Myxococcales bacterium]|nr:50S ribosomal protein L11 methyltransferase [Myxococcales bacterium]MDP3503686.1 50S ribosomal protein L11 methyltransferase [Myxococcales bacterium]